MARGVAKAGRKLSQRLLPIFKGEADDGIRVAHRTDWDIQPIAGVLRVVQMVMRNAVFYAVARVQKARAPRGDRASGSALDFCVNTGFLRMRCADFILQDPNPFSDDVVIQGIGVLPPVKVSSTLGETRP